jgi:hypothetical protein
MPPATSGGLGQTSASTPNRLPRTETYAGLEKKPSQQTQCHVAISDPTVVSVDAD